MRENSLDPIRQVIGVHAKAIAELHERMHKIEGHVSGDDLARVDAALRVLGRDDLELTGRVATLEAEVATLYTQVVDVIDFLRIVRDILKTPGREVLPNASFTNPSDPIDPFPIASRPDS